MGFSKAAAYLGDNSVQIDAEEFETDARSDDPQLLQDDEHVAYAFKGRGGKGRDSFMFTSKRIIIVDKKGITGKRVSYVSVPYKSIRAFAIETSGSLDDDKELKMYARGVGKISLDFVKDVDVIAIKRFLSFKVLQEAGSGEETEGAVVHDESAEINGGTGFLDLLGSNFSQIDSETIESWLRSDPNILLPDETVELAFKCSRDSFILTSKRIIKIDVQGLSGKKIEFLSILWLAVKAFSVETAGNVLDRDSELTVYVNLPDVHSRAEGFPRNSRTRMKIDFRDGKADIFAVQKYFADKLLGMDTLSPSEYAVDMEGVEDTGSDSSLAWLGDDNRMIDPSLADRQFHSSPPILQNCETVEMAFKGRRDMILFTGKRIIFVDVQGFLGLGNKVEYISLPWTTVTAFSVRTAGSWVDKDSEMSIWLDFDDVFNPRRKNQDDPHPPPIPRKSFLEIDFQRDKVDVMVVHRYLSERCMRVNGHEMRAYDVPVSDELMQPSPPGQLDDLMNWIGDDAAAIEAEAVDTQFHDAGILQEDEHVAFAFKAGRDSLYFTNKRLFLIDVQGVSGNKKDYISIPFDSIRAWAVESAGSFDLDMEMKVWFKAYWKNSKSQDLRSGMADVIAIQNYIAHFIIGDADGSSALDYAQNVEKAGSMDEFFSFINDNAFLQDPAEVTETLRTSPAILQEDESIDAAYKTGRDFFLITTKRIITVDKKGVTGKSVEYKSFPLMYNKAFSIETDGHLLHGAEVKVYTEDEDVEQELANGANDLWSVHEILSNKMLDNHFPEIGVDDV